MCALNYKTCMHAPACTHVTCLYILYILNGVCGSTIELLFYINLGSDLNGEITYHGFTLVINKSNCSKGFKPRAPYLFGNI